MTFKMPEKAGRGKFRIECVFCFRVSFGFYAEAGSFNINTMNCLDRLCCGALALLLCALAAGCFPSGQSQFEEEKEPHFIAGKSALNSMDYKGAIEEFEKAVEVNPHSAAAHFQLGWLYEEKEPDPAAAIYHYQKFLKLRPGADNAEVIRQHIMNCKQDLAKAVLPLPITPAMQKQIDQLADENKNLRDQLEKWRAYCNGLQSQLAAERQGSSAAQSAAAVSNRLVSSPATQSVSRVSEPQTSPISQPPASKVAARSHTVRSGETCASIARKYGVRLEALLAANPSVQPRRLRVGQALNIP